jgi:hypothetical protein
MICGVTTMTTGGATLTDGAVTKTGEATRAGGATATGGGKTLAGIVVTITGVCGSMTVCRVSTIVASGTKPCGAINTRGVTVPGCTDVPKLVLKNTRLWGAPKPKKARPRAAALVANNRTPESPIARINL